MKVAFALAATVLRAVSWIPFIWTGKKLADAARWFEERS